MRVTEDGVPVGDLVAIIKESVRQAGVSRASGPGDLRVGSVRLILQVVAGKTAGGAVDFRVPLIGLRLRAGADLSRQDTHTVDIALVPPAGAQPRAAAGEVETALVEAIATIRQAMASAAGGDDPWGLSGATADLCFAVTRKGTISVGADGELAGQLTHTIRLSLVPGQDQPGTPPT